MNSVVADSQGNAYVASWTGAPDYPHTQGLPAGPIYTFDIVGGIAFVTGAFFAQD
jgi:hypothetical protein